MDYITTLILYVFYQEQQIKEQRAHGIGNTKESRPSQVSAIPTPVCLQNAESLKGDLLKRNVCKKSNTIKKKKIKYF